MFLRRYSRIEQRVGKIMKLRCRDVMTDVRAVTAVYVAQYKSFYSQNENIFSLPAMSTAMQK